MTPVRFKCLRIAGARHERKAHSDTRAFARRGIDGKGSADKLGALYHARQTVSAKGIPPAEGLLNVEAAPVVGNFEHDPMCVAFQDDVNLGSLTVPGGIVQGFLQHPVNDDFERFRNILLPGQRCDGTSEYCRIFLKTAVYTT